MYQHYNVKVYFNIYCTVKNMGGKKSLANYRNSPSFFANFHYH